MNAFKKKSKSPFVLGENDVRGVIFERKDNKEN